MHTKKLRDKKMKVQRPFFRTSIVIGALLWLAGCAAVPGTAPKPEAMAGTVTSSAGLNPDFQGRASPVVLRVYQLKGAGSFRSADFFSLYNNAKGVLAADLVSSDELRVQPGATMAYETEFDPATKYVAVLAAFRDIENASWRSVEQLPEGSLVGTLKFWKDNHLQITLQDLAVSVAIVKQ